MDGFSIQIGGQTFYTAAGVEVRPRVRTGYLLDNEGSTTMQIISALLGGTDFFPNISQRRGIHLDLGGGEYIVQLEFSNWEGSEFQWGGYAGADPTTQLEVMMDAFVTTQVDSFRPAILEYGEHHAGGIFSPVPVALEAPETVRAPDQPSTFDGSLVAIATATFDAQTFQSALDRL